VNQPMSASEVVGQGSLAIEEVATAEDRVS
jgi:hypothetical protein